ncbi:MAG TPA: mandelate racemase/muconate lactonizing enzyme family protein [Planctomycetes bacterium]|nr:mandelate racemase/muconate lactonizing enzyme family protein [Planctomycetota bacterium]
MKITGVEPIHLRVPNVEAIPDGTLDVLIVRIHTDEGITGVGEVTSQSYVCKACFEAPRSAARRHGLTSILLGEDPTDPVALWEKMYYETNRYGRRGAAIHAISGADIALWDIKGQAEGKPVSELLGGRLRDDVRAYASVLFADTPEQTAEMAKQYVEMGLTAVKFGWGPIGDDAAVDVAHVQAAREAIGAERDLMVDAGHAWDWETALGRTELFQPFNLTWLEEPVGQDDRHGYRELCKRSQIPIAGGEGDVTHFDFKELIDCGIHVVQPDIAFCGGITVCKRVSDMTTAHGRKAVPHCFSTGINLAASLHWISTVADGDLVEYCLRPSPLMRKLVANLPQVISGRVPVPTEPGLGIELDEDVIEEFRVR